MEKIEQWRGDNLNAKDPLLQHDLAQARADSVYFGKHRDWVRWAERETVRREEAKDRAQRLEASNAEREKALEARIRAGQEQAAARDRSLDEQRQARNARLAANVRRLP